MSMAEYAKRVWAYAAKHRCSQWLALECCVEDGVEPYYRVPKEYQDGVSAFLRIEASNARFTHDD